MANNAAQKGYRATIGIECHVQLRTATKLFAGIDNDAREAAPNSLIGPLCYGLPGALPVLNREAVRLGMRAAFALHTTPQRHLAFDRKHYFYPDLPLGYQITQFEHPIVKGGWVAIEVDGMKRKVGITRAHLEADAGKSTHPVGGDYSLVDLNRAGTPLLEIVSEPDMYTAAEAKAYAKELYLALRYADVSDCNLYYGNMRFDVNVSVSKTDKLGTRTETKNLNSFRSVEKAIEFEIARQIDVLEKGGTITQETRGWDDTKQRTFSQRSKEEAHDYRYFPDPDLPPVMLDDSLIDAVKAEMPTSPGEWRVRLHGLGMDDAQTLTLLMAELDDATVGYLPLIEAELKDKPRAKAMANWMVNIEVPLRRDQAVKSQLDNEGRLHLYRVVFDLVQNGKLGSTNAKLLITKMLEGTAIAHDIEAFARQHNLIQESDTGAIEKIAQQVIEENPKAAQDIRDGELKAIGFLVGQVMKHSQGRANPQLAQQALKKQLGL